ncbi:MAG: glycosyltransferase family 2 protein [Bacilli bacterium]
MSELISIIVPIYNCERFIDKCIKSILNQTYNNIEIILIDDFSNDNSYNICQLYAYQDKRIKLVKNITKGVSNARNYGVSISNAKNIMFVDSDDWLDLNCCEYLLFLKEKYCCDFVACSYYINDSYSIKKEKILLLENDKILENYFSRSNIMTCVWNKLYDKKIINNIKFNSNYIMGEDVLFTCNIIANSKKIVCTNIPKYHYNVLNSNSVTSVTLNLGKFRSNINAHWDQIKLLQNKYFYNKKIYNKCIEKLINLLKENYNIKKEYTNCPINNEIILNIKKLNSLYKKDKLIYKGLAFKLTFMNYNIELYYLLNKFVEKILKLPMRIIICLKK